MSHPKLALLRTEEGVSRTGVAASRTEVFDRWFAQLQHAEERYGPAWAHFAETLEEHRAGLQTMANGPFAVRRSRLPQSALEFLSTLRTITDLTAKGPRDSVAGMRPTSARAHERRLACRYPIEVPLEYRLMAHGEIIGTGMGRTVDISSSGILFESDRTLPAQRIIQLRLDWPGRRGTAMPVELQVTGRTVRRRGHRTAL